MEMHVWNCTTTHILGVIRCIMYIELNFGRNTYRNENICTLTSWESPSPNMDRMRVIRAFP